MNSRWISFWKEKARALQVQTLALFYASRDPRVPWYAKAWIAMVVAYAFSPIDLIPDFIPVLGYLDDLVLIPLGVLVALKMIPTPVMEESRAKAEEAMDAEKPEFRFMIGVVVGVWLLMILLVAGLFIKFVYR